MTVLLLVNSSKTLRTSGSSIHYLVFKDPFCFFLAPSGKRGVYGFKTLSQQLSTKISDFFHLYQKSPFLLVFLPEKFSILIASLFCTLILRTWAPSFYVNTPI
jgi:hypothetical protein